MACFLLLIRDLGAISHHCCSVRQTRVVVVDKHHKYFSAKWLLAAGPVLCSVLVAYLLQDELDSTANKGHGIETLAWATKLFSSSLTTIRCVSPL